MRDLYLQLKKYRTLPFSIAYRPSVFQVWNRYVESISQLLCLNQ